MIEFHPGFILLTGAVLAAFLPGRARQFIMILAPLLALFALIGLKEGTYWSYTFINNLNLLALKVDPLSWIFGLIFCIIALIGNIYAIHIKKGGESAAGLVYAGSALGVVFAGDWLTLIVFWELMTISSVFLVWYSKTPRAFGAGLRYILVHFFGGNLLLFGIVLKVMAGETEISLLSGTGGAAFWLILLGICVNTAVPPLHAWLTDAYPEGTISGTVFLGAFTTKVAVYCLIRLFPGTDVLIWIGVVMAIYGIIYAVLENDIRRLLSYHIVCQVGFMVAGAGMGTELALNGAVAHAYSNILFKSLLFMATGAVIYATGRRKLTELGGLFKEMPHVTALYMVGAFSISGVPLFNGYISKSMIISAAAGNYLPAVELLLYLASVGTFLSVCLKLPYYIFWGTDNGAQVKEKLPFNMVVAMAASASLCFLYGVNPSLLYRFLPFDAVYQPFTWDHAISTLQLQIAVLAVFVLYMKKLGGKAAVSLDTDWFYRRPLNYLIFLIVRFVTLIQAKFALTGNRLLFVISPFIREPIHACRIDRMKTELFCPFYSDEHYRFPVGAVVFAVVLTLVLVFIYVIL